MRRKRARSIVSRILWLHGFAVVLTAIVVSTTIYLFLDSTADRLQRQTLLVHAEALGGDLEIARDGHLRLRPDLASASLYGGGSGLSFVIVDDQAKAMFSSTPAPALPIANIPRQAAIASFRRQSRRAIYSGISVPMRIGPHRLWVATIQNLEHPDYIVDDIIAEFLIYGVAIILPLLLALLAIDVVIIRRALRPVVAASALVETLDRRRLDVRLPVSELPTEVRPLVEAANEAFDRLVASYRIQRDFTADAAHELRTPLTIVRMRVQAIADEALAGELRADIDVLTRIVNQLLEIAELDITSSAITGGVDLHALAVEGVSAIAPLAYREGKTLAVAAPDAPVWVRGEAELILRALGALLGKCGQAHRSRHGDRGSG